MNKHLFRAAGAAGLLALAWVAAGYTRQPLALAMTALITAFYAAGWWELRRFDADTQALRRALDGLATPPSALADWLATVPAALRPAVRARVAGERAPLPGPALAPFIAGLLVLLGMLGTFLGMVVTLNGTGVALEHAGDVAAMRETLAAPVRGLGLAFGTSVAGVAGSAMLGLMTALCRRARADTGPALDAAIAGALQPFTPAHQRTQERAATFQLLQQQAAQGPLLVERLTALMAQLEQQSRAANEQLLAQQRRFHEGAETAYRQLAASVDQALQRSLDGAARTAAATLQPAVEATMGGIARETAALHATVAATVQQQLDGLAQRFEAQSTTWLDRQGEQARQQAATLLQALDEAQARRHAEQAAADAQRLAAWTQQLETMAQQLAQTSGHLSAQAEAQARHTIDEVARLVHSAAEAPRAAAELVAQLRDKLSDSLAQDNALLEERSRIMATLNTLLAAVQHTATDQKAAIDALVAATAGWLQEAGARFTEKVDAETARLDAVSTQLTASAVDVASLGEAFGAAVTLFGQTGGQMLAHLQRVEEALAQATARSDEQLAYYVAQAREVIDLSLHAQKQVMDDLQRLANRQAALTDAAA